MRPRPTLDALETYRIKRNFGRTPEPRGEVAASGDELVFVVQKHAATRLHYDFRLELDGVMLSWAIPKGPSYDPKEKRMAVRVEDHPISYNSFEGTIPPKLYGAGNVIIWDRGSWRPVGDARAGLAAGKLLFSLHGQKLAGLWELVRIGKPDDRQIAWILFKKHDAFERPQAVYDVVTALPDSVVAKPLGLIGAAAGQASPSLAASAEAAPTKAALPTRLSPQLATQSTGVPPSGRWTFEIKLDGYRVMTRIDQGVPRLITRGGHDWSAKLPTLVREIAALGLHSGWLDGEIVVLGPAGTPDFNALQNAFDAASTRSVLYFLFDLPFCEGHDLRRAPLRERRQLLRSLLDTSDGEQLRFSADFEADAASILQSASRMNLEGVIAKRSDAPYVSARTETWLKLKCRQRQEFVVAGYADRGDDEAATEVGSLMLGVYDASGALLPVGNVGTGWTAKSSAALKARLLPLRVKAAPFGAAGSAGSAKKGRWSKRAAGTERWVEPSVVVEVSFADWTPDGHIRHATFEGVRLDKPAREVVREAVVTPAGAFPLTGKGALSTKVSHPERVIDASTGLTKLDLVRYYESVADWLVPHLKGRPCSLVRGPAGVAGELFFQKHLDQLNIPEVTNLDPALWPGHTSLIEVGTAAAIAGAAQMNVIEFHTWNATAMHIDQPDRMVFDLDPGEGVAWKQVQEAALLTRSFLEDLGLQAWLKTSGGKGLHVVVPLAPRHEWATVKALSQAIVQQLARVIPGRFVDKSGPANRVGRIFVDYLRNNHGATTAAAFSARARPGLGVSMPIGWDALAAVKGGAHWTIATAREHLSFQREDPWGGYWSSRQTLTQAIKLLGLKTPRAEVAAGVNRRRPADK